MKGFDRLLGSELAPIIILGVVAIVAFEVLKNAVGAASKAVVNTAGATVDAASQFATGNLATAGTPYQGTGIVGEIGAGTNAILGGLPSDLGTWIGGKIADYTQQSATDQSSTNNPYSAGSSANYAAAADASPTPATAAANPAATTDLNFGLYGNSW